MAVFGYELGERWMNGRRADIDARADAYFDQPFDLQRDQRLAHRRPRDTELLREITLRRQSIAKSIFAGLDQSADLFGDLPIQAARFDADQRHGEGGPVVTVSACKLMQCIGFIERLVQGTGRLIVPGKEVKRYDQFVGIQFKADG